MKYATSIYLGGEPIQARDCDHQSTRELGLLCPTCKEAVFLVSGYGFDRADKRVSIDPHFSHYKGGSIECEMRCEQRSREDWEKLRAEARNQRLDLFNRQFFDVFWAALNEGCETLPPPYKGRLRQTTKQWRNFAAIEVRRYLQEHFDMVQECLFFECEKAFDKSAPTMLLSPKADVQFAAKTVERYYRKANRRMHECVVQEALLFLSQRTAGYALARVCGMIFAGIEFREDLATIKREQDICFSDPKRLSDLLINQIANARWLGVLPDFLK